MVDIVAFIATSDIGNESQGWKEFALVPRLQKINEDAGHGKLLHDNVDSLVFSFGKLDEEPYEALFLSLELSEPRLKQVRPRSKEVDELWVPFMLIVCGDLL